MRRALSLAVIGATVLGGTVRCRAEYGPPVVFNCSTTPVRVSIVRPDRKRISVSVKPMFAIVAALLRNETPFWNTRAPRKIGAPLYG